MEFMKQYYGPMGSSDNIMVKRAISKFYGQMKRCYNKNCPKYKNYGARGISVNYSVREFIYWFLKSTKNTEIDISQISVGRKDHNKNYDLENIKIETISENSRERMIRDNPSKKKRRKVNIYCSKTNVIIAIADHARHAAEYTNYSKSSIHIQCKNKVSTNRPFYFRYREEA